MGSHSSRSILGTCVTLVGAHDAPDKEAPWKALSEHSRPSGAVLASRA